MVLEGLKVQHKYVDAEFSDDSSTMNELEVLIIPVGQDLPSTVHVDLTFSLGRESRLRHAPSIRLVANNSAEHVMQQITDLVTVISTVASLGDSVGICPTDTGDAPNRIVQLLCGHGFEVGLLQDVVCSSSQYDQISYSASMEDGRTTQSGQMRDKLPDLAPQIIVTEIDGMEVHTEAPMSSEYTSANVNGDSEEKDISAFQDAFASHFPEHTDEHTPAGNQADSQAQFISPVHLEKTPTRIYEQVRNEIWSKPSEEQQRISNLEDDIERMMDRFDELRQECRELAQQRDEASEQAASFQKRFEKVLEEARTARQEKNEMRMSLERLKMPPLPEETSPEYQKTENTRLKSELEKAHRLSDSKAQDFEFVRQQYQQSSSAAAELAGENATLTAEITTLKNKIADGLGYKLAVLQTKSVQDALKEEAEKLSLRNNVLIEQLRRMRDDKLTSRGREGRRDIAMQERKRASSASAEVGQRKKVDKIGQSRLSVASLVSPTPTGAHPQAPTSNPSASVQQMMRGQSHDSRAYTRDRTPKRVRTPF
ncbi:protein of unknown function [Taphrina deformans PYCC 5710]|uniref:Uncharacterized protein n=1 Tax=Taphrina deformans (strain PYCC 5710 / ATCC 11124 / CBS 356.35 / IMI 108563 / JCM 9778 / NBRC 8474) TaxID=1097556 RepID=R4XC61_TAPDE|nr:protein of unknown function [Taphrina deformans PYCC 5710]|eukprot:CCG83145.1 protein of unknown function [Taphrina deformans PYCC 5710]